MSNNQNEIGQEPQKAVFFSLFGSLFIVFAILMVAPTNNAAELNPVENLNPPQSEPSMAHLPERATLIMDEKQDQLNTGNSKSKPSWWNWLTNASNKPANFHFIDILELLD